MANRAIQARQTVIDSRYVHLAKWCVSEMHEQGSAGGSSRVIKGPITILSLPVYLPL
jgi:hypothetical protein